MISTAHIGVGIIGREGLQASRVSDYAISQFSFLRRLLFVHGRECFRKNSFITLFTFYKNIIVLVPLIIYQIFFKRENFKFYDGPLFEYYNILEMSFILIWYAIADSQVSKSKLEHNPRYYIQGIKQEYFNNVKFWMWCLYAALKGIFLFLFFIQFCPIVEDIGVDITETKKLGIYIFKLGFKILITCIIITNLKLLFNFNSFTGIEIVWTFISVNFIIFCFVNMIEILRHRLKKHQFDNFNFSIEFYVILFLLCVFSYLLEVGYSYLNNIFFNEENIEAIESLLNNTAYQPIFNENQEESINFSTCKNLCLN